MHSAGNFNPEWGYLAPAPSFMRTARAVLVATAIGATAGAAVVISLIDRPADDAGKARSITAHAIVTGVQAATAPTTPPAAAAAASVAAPISLTATAAPAAAVPAAAVGAPIAVTATAAPAVAAAPAASVAAPIASAATSTALPAVQPQSPAVRVMLPSPPQVATHPAHATAMQSAAIVPAAEDGRASDADAAPSPKPVPGIAALSEAAPTGAPDQSLTPPQTVPPDKKKRHVAGAYESNKPLSSLGTVLRRIFSPHGGTSYYPNR